MLGLYLTPAPVSVYIGDWEYTIPALRADRWLIALTESPDNVTYAVVPGLLGDDDQAHLLARVAHGEVPSEDVHDAALAAVKEASGLEWWEALRLTGSADQPRGELYGNLLLAGLDPRRMTLAAWCAATFAYLMDGRDEKERSKLLQSLIMPPVGVPLEDVQGWDTGRPEGF